MVGTKDGVLFTMSDSALINILNAVGDETDPWARQLVYVKWSKTELCSHPAKEKKLVAEAELC